MNIAPELPLAADAEPLAGRLRNFGEKVRRQVPTLLRGYQEALTSGAFSCYVDQPGLPRRVRPWCDAVEIGAMFGLVPDCMPREAWIEALRGFQNPETGLVPEQIPASATRNPPPRQDPRFEERYNTMIVHYALECLGSCLAYPVSNAEAVEATALVQALESLRWRDGAWHAGAWIDEYAACLCANQQYFEGGAQLETLFSWLDTHAEAATGLWGTWREEDRWLQPVNGFYRLTRGTYAQFGRSLPHPREAIDTLLIHAADPAFFANGKGNACNVLDVVHPLWLCRRQSEHRRVEAMLWVRSRLPDVLSRWEDNRGIAFDPAAGSAARPGLQGTEMWLSIIYLVADLLGLATHLGYRPRGVHRPEPATEQS